MQLFYCYFHLRASFCLCFVGYSSSKTYHSCAFSVVEVTERSAGCSKLWVGLFYIYSHRYKYSGRRLFVFCFCSIIFLSKIEQNFKHSILNSAPKFHYHCTFFKQSYMVFRILFMFFIDIIPCFLQCRYHNGNKQLYCFIVLSLADVIFIFI